MVAVKLIGSSVFLFLVTLGFSPPVFPETLTWSRGPGGCTFMEGNPFDRDTFVLRECSRRGERRIKPVAVVFLERGVFAVEMPGYASNYTGIWCSRDAPRPKGNLRRQCGPKGW